MPSGLSGGTVNHPPEEADRRFGELLQVFDHAYFSRLC